MRAQICKGSVGDGEEMRCFAGQITLGWMKMRRSSNVRLCCGQCSSRLGKRGVDWNWDLGGTDMMMSHRRRVCFRLSATSEVLPE
jgi:hypothetical protein